MKNEILERWRKFRADEEDRAFVVWLCGSRARMRVLDVVAMKDIHKSGLVRELGLSLSHLNKVLGLLERMGLIEIKKMGMVHMISFKPKRILIEIKKGVGIRLKVE